MKKEKKLRMLKVLDLVCLALSITVGIINLAGTGDFRWICWVVIVACLYLRIWMATDMLQRAWDEAETWRVLYQKEANKFLDLEWKTAQSREDGEE